MVAMKTNIKRAILKGAVFTCVFVVSIIIIGRVMNRGNNNMTMEMAPATLPLISMEMETSTGERIAYNRLHGYRQEMDVAFQRQTVTELGSSREAYFTVDTYGRKVEGLSVELRSVSGERLIENSPVTDYTDEGSAIHGKVALKDLIDPETEYAMVLLLDIGEDEPIRYYTRVLWSEDTHGAEILSYVKYFHETLYDKEKAKDLVMYLESNSQGDNSSFHRVDIHSSFYMITWGDLEVREVMAPSISLTELASQTASVVLEYLVSSKEGEIEMLYRTKEYYRIRYTPDRMYLLDFKREMTQIPDPEHIVVNDKILLGVVGDEVSFVESEDGNIIVFEAGGSLCSYNVTTNKLSRVFNFYQMEEPDPRTFYSQHDVKILDVDEGGNIRFAVYGYMNRGSHEGEVGAQIYFYDSMMNTVEEAIYLPYDKSFSVLDTQLEQLLYLNRTDKLYLFWDDSVYGINLHEKKYQKIFTARQDNSMQVSDNHTILVWQEGSDLYGSNRLMMRNLNTEQQHTIDADPGEAIYPLGFMGEDIIYGVARQADIVKERTGAVFFPMYKVCIQNSQGVLLMEYRQDDMDIYITGCLVSDNQIILTQVARTPEGIYTNAPDNQITNNAEMTQGKNTLVTVTTQMYGNYVQIQTRNTIDTKTIQILTPKEVMFEGNRELALVDDPDIIRYYVYGDFGVNTVTSSPARAIRLAYEEAGVVNNGKGECIWLKGNRVVRNQIMAIEAAGVTETSGSLAVCLDTILNYEGVIRNSQYLLDQGQTAKDILQENLEHVQILDLAGCQLDAVLYYVNQDIPVLAFLDNREAVLITGFNEFNIVVMEPETGRLYKKGINDSSAWFEENGNNFLTYVRVTD
jgi:hypothetical protein